MCFAENHTCLIRDELEFVVRMTYDAFRNGIYLRDLDESPTRQWGYARACIFCTTAVTTIGETKTLIIV